MTHYPFGGNSEETNGSRADIVYRRVPVYSESLMRQISQSVASGAANRKATVDVGACVPKAPVVRQLFVEADTGRPIGDYINI